MIFNIKILFKKPNKGGTPANDSKKKKKLYFIKLWLLISLKFVFNNKVEYTLIYITNNKKTNTTQI